MTASAPRVVIVDSGMRGLGGHNFAYTTAVRQAFEDQGAHVDVLVNRGFPGDRAEANRFHPVFTSGAYDHPLGHGRWRDLVYLRAQGRVFAEELWHGLRCVLHAEPALIFCHTVADFELVGWPRYLRLAGHAGALAIVLRQTPGFGAIAWWRRNLHPYWSLKPKALARLRRQLGPRFMLCTDSRPLSEDYAAIHGDGVVTLPIPVGASVTADAPPGALSQRYQLGDASRLRVGYVGDARASKGFPLLPKLVEAMRRTGPAVRFVIQCPRAGSGDDQSKLPEGLAELRALAAGADDLTLIPESLSNEDYGELLRSLDVVLLPYLHPSYREATSGIFAEALALGRPVVVPSGTWMARELGASRAGVVFPREQPDEMALRLAELIRAYPEHAAAAREQQAAWQDFHRPATLARMLLEEARARAAG